MTTNFKNQRGFSLIELIVYVGVMVILTSAIVFFAIWAIQIGSKIKINYALTNNARRAMEVMTYEIRKSKSVYAPTSVFGVSPGQLSLEQTVVAGSPETAIFIDFFQCGQSLCEKKEGQDVVALTNDQVKITNLSFTQLLNSSAVPSIQISFRLEAANSSTRPEYSGFIELTSTATLRPY